MTEILHHQNVAKRLFRLAMQSNDEQARDDYMKASMYAQAKAYRLAMAKYAMLN